MLSNYNHLRKLKTYLSPFSIAMKVHRLLKLPAMTGRERSIYKRVLLSLYGDEPMNIFEYGTGYSTIYYAEFLSRNKIPFHIYSVENNFEWYRKTKELVKARGLENRITLLISEFKPFWEKEGWDWTAVPKCGQFAPKTRAELKYINTPGSIGKKFEFISVDGRFRRRCLEILPEYLKQHGVVFLHDAHKKHYHSSISIYKSSKFYDGGKYYPFETSDWKVWIGSFADRLLI